MARIEEDGPNTGDVDVPVGSRIPGLFGFAHWAPQEEQLAAGIEPGLFRVSVGIENIDDIIYDFDQAFRKLV